MARNTSIILGDHFEMFVDQQVGRGRYGSTSEVVRAGLPLLEEYEVKAEILRKTRIAGEDSGDAVEINMEAIKQKARLALQDN